MQIYILTKIFHTHEIGYVVVHLLLLYAIFTYPTAYIHVYFTSFVSLIVGTSIIVFFTVCTCIYQYMYSFNAEIMHRF